MIEDVELGGIDFGDYPDFCDAYISGAVWKNSGIELTESELDEINENRELVYEQVFNYLF